MTERDTRPDPFDALTEGIRTDSLSDDAVQQATDRAWAAISRELDHSLSGCEDYQALIPALVDSVGSRILASMR